MFCIPNDCYVLYTKEKKIFDGIGGIDKRKSYFKTIYYFHTKLLSI